MTEINISTSIEDLSKKVSIHLFDEMREQIDSIDTQLSDQGVDSPTFILLTLSALASMMTEYTTYMAAGLYTITKDEEVARDAVKAILRDQKRAAETGLERAVTQAQAINKEIFAESAEAVAELLKRASKKCH